MQEIPTSWGFSCDRLYYMKTECKIGQSFGGNATETYINNGLKGHCGVDNSCGYGSPIHSYFDTEYVYKVLTKEHPSNDGTGFTGVFTIIDNGIEVFEFLYGHCNPSVTVGQILTKGTVLGTEANNGEVYSNGVRITLEMQKAGDTRGTHRHDQKRILRKDKNIQPNTRYITDEQGKTLYYNGYYYAIPYYNNGYNGCTNWLLPLFNRDLFFGCRGYDVQCLQNFLKARGFLNIAETTDYFGLQTKQAVSAFQKANAINPVLGYVGQKTRDLINSILK